MKLHELEVGDARAGQKRERDAVAGGDGRIGRLAEDLSGAAGREQRGRRARLDQPAVAVEESDATRRARRSTIACTTVAWSIDRQRRRRAEPRGQHAADLPSGGVCGVQHAPHRVRALARQMRRAVRQRGRTRRPTRAARRRSAAPRCDQDVHGLRVAQAVAGRDRVGGVQRRRVVGADRCRNAALRVASAARAGSALVSTRTRPCACERDRRPQAGDAAADDEEVGAKLVGHQRPCSTCLLRWSPINFNRIMIDANRKPSPGRERLSDSHRRPGDRTAYDVLIGPGLLSDVSASRGRAARRNRRGRQLRPGLAPAWPPAAGQRGRAARCSFPTASAQRRSPRSARLYDAFVAPGARSRRAPSSRSAAAWSATWRALPPRPTCVASDSSRCRRRSWRRWIARSAARPASTCARARTSSARFIRRRWSSAIPTCCARCRAREFRVGLYEVRQVRHHRVAAAVRPRDVSGLMPCSITTSWSSRRSWPNAAGSRRRVVTEDERESGLRRILNFGHTVGHALEALTRYRRFRHGEAIGYGMLAAARLSAARGMMSRDEAVA